MLIIAILLIIISLILLQFIVVGIGWSLYEEDWPTWLKNLLSYYTLGSPITSVLSPLFLSLLIIFFIVGGAVLVVIDHMRPLFEKALRVLKDE